MTRTIPRAGLKDLPRGSILLLASALLVGMGLPILLAIAPPVAAALGHAGWTAIITSAVLTLAILGGALYVRAHRAGGEAGVRFDARLRVAAGVAAIVVLLVFPAQMSVFALAWPPPETAQEHFDLLDENRLVGLLSLDLLLMLDWIVLLALWAGLFAALRPVAPRAMLVAIALVVVSTLAYFASNTAFDMVTLGSQHAAAGTSAERAEILAAGEAALATFEGPWFTASYVLSGIAVTLASIVMWRDARFGKPVGGIGVAYGLLQIVPPNLGMVGMAMSLASLPLMLAWLGMLAWKLLRPRQRAERDGLAAGALVSPDRARR